MVHNELGKNGKDFGMNWVFEREGESCCVSITGILRTDEDTYGVAVFYQQFVNEELLMLSS